MRPNNGKFVVMQIYTLTIFANLIELLLVVNLLFIINCDKFCCIKWRCYVDDVFVGTTRLTFGNLQIQEITFFFFFNFSIFELWRILAYLQNLFWQFQEKTVIISWDDGTVLYLLNLVSANGPHLHNGTVKATELWTEVHNALFDQPEYSHF